MTTDNPETLVIVKPRRIMQIISVSIEILWIDTALRGLHTCFFKVDSGLTPLLLFFILLFLGSVFWIILNTINTTIVVKTDCIIMQGVFWKTQIPWEAVKEIKLRYYQKNRSRGVEIYAKRKQLPFNNKISFDTNFHRDVRKGVHYILELARQKEIFAKTTGWLSPSYREWREWAKN
jgi:dUTPase